MWKENRLESNQDNNRTRHREQTSNNASGEWRHHPWLYERRNVSTETTAPESSRASVQIPHTDLSYIQHPPQSFPYPQDTSSMPQGFYDGMQPPDHNMYERPHDRNMLTNHPDPVYPDIPSSSQAHPRPQTNMASFPPQQSFPYPQDTSSMLQGSDDVRQYLDHNMYGPLPPPYYQIMHTDHLNPVNPAIPSLESISSQAHPRPQTNMASLYGPATMQPPYTEPHGSAYDFPNFQRGASSDVATSNESRKRPLKKRKIAKDKFAEPSFSAEENTIIPDTRIASGNISDERLSILRPRSPSEVRNFVRANIERSGATEEQIHRYFAITRGEGQGLQPKTTAEKEGRPEEQRFMEHLIETALEKIRQKSPYQEWQGRK